MIEPLALLISVKRVVSPVERLQLYQVNFDHQQQWGFVVLVFLLSMNRIIALPAASSFSTPFQWKDAP